MNRKSRFISFHFFRKSTVLLMSLLLVFCFSGLAEEEELEITEIIENVLLDENGNEIPEQSGEEAESQPVLSAREDFIDRIIMLGKKLYDDAGGKRKRAHYASDIYVCKNFTVYLFRQNREDFRMALTTDEDGTVIHETMNYISVLIDSDEKGEAPSVSFSARTIKADVLNAYIALERKGTEHTVLEGCVRTKDGTAKAGTNYAETAVEFVMLPYQNLTVVMIPVTGEKKDLNFEVELYDLKSAKAGAVTTVTVVIPKTYDVPALVRDRTRLAPRLLAASGKAPAGQESSYTIDGKECRIDWQSGENYGLIYDPDYAKNVVMGRVYKPVKIVSGNTDSGKKYEESTWNHFGDYGAMCSASAKFEEKYNRWNLYFRSMWFGDKGGTQVLYNIETGRWQSVFFESESL